MQDLIFENDFQIALNFTMPRNALISILKLFMKILKLGQNLPSPILEVYRTSLI